MIKFRDRKAAEIAMDLIVQSNQEGNDACVGPFSHGSSVHTDILKTLALKQALDKHKFDVAFGGVYYVIIDAGQMGLEITPANARQMVEQMGLCNM